MENKNTIIEELTLGHINQVCREYAEYIKKLKRYEKYSETARRELAHLETITMPQRKELEKCFKELKKSRSPYKKDYHSICQNLGKISAYLERKTSIPNRAMIDFGTNIILETKYDNVITVSSPEYVSTYYKKDYLDQYLSIKSYKGFLLYKAQIGDQFTINGSTTDKESIITISQFGVNRQSLLLPKSANLSNYSQVEKIESNFREKYQKNLHVRMTPSQKELLEKELAKISINHIETPYINKLMLLKEKVENNPHFVLTEDEVNENGEYIGIGSKVCYGLLLDDDIIEHSRELISCAFTVEENNEYIEEFTPLGKSLIGKRKDEVFLVEIDGKIEKGIILSVTNKEKVQEKTYKK